MATFLARMITAKEAIADFYWKIGNALENSGVTIKLPDLSHYPSNASVSYDNVFKDVSSALAQKNIEIGYINDGSDTYHAFLFDQSNRDRVTALMLLATQMPFTFGRP